MRVLVLSSVYPSATIPTRGIFVHERTRHLAQNCPVEVVAPVSWFPFNRLLRGSERALVPAVETRDGLTVFHPRFLSLPRIGKSLDGLLYFASVLPFLIRLRRRFRFDLIDAHFAYPDGLAGVLLGWVFGVPVAVTLRGTEARLAGSRLRRPQVARVVRAADQVIAVSQSLADLAAALGAPPARLRMIPNGVDSARFRPGPKRDARRRLGLPPDSPLIVSIGGLTERKGHHRVLAVLPELLPKHPDLLFAAVGGPSVEGDTGPLLRRLTAELGLGEHVLLPGPTPHEQIASWLQAADIFCLATRNEGRPNAVLEALACGLPVVATDVGGNPEVVQSGRDGLLVPFGEQAALSDAILAALATEWDREAISGRARSRTWEHTAAQVLGELESMRGDRRPSDRAPLADPARRRP
ncbi:MAG: glycosyltransferase [Candidatus Rokuibacteriota bacterium]